MSGTGCTAVTHFSVRRRALLVLLNTQLRLSRLAPNFKGWLDGVCRLCQGSRNRIMRFVERTASETQLFDIYPQG